MIERFMNPEAGESRTLADLIMQRFEEHTAEVQAKQGGPRQQQGDPDMPAPRRVLPGVDQKVRHTRLPVCSTDHKFCVRVNINKDQLVCLVSRPRV